MKKDFLLSVIVPVYNEEGGIGSLMERLLPVVEQYKYEVIFVDDGSKDGTVADIKVYTEKNKHIKLISFVRNFSHQTALTCGYLHAQGDAVVSIDADLQDPPELIHEMILKWQEGYKVIYARRSARHESLFKTATADMFYRLINFLSDTEIPHNVGDFRLIDRDVVEMLNKLPEHARFLRGLVAWGGFSSAYVSFERKERVNGETHYPFKKMMGFALNGIVSFSSKPLRFATHVGFLCAVLGFVGIVYAISRRLFLPHEYWVTGWTTIFVSIMFFGGMQLIAIGIIGEYISRIYTELQNRPQFLVKEKVNI
ncbi:MAG: hypothetical protein UZ22_OP11002000815 [Microgenomates bacterium OLB23]|nr:MAG: hypothetical protein UZ22_OP11002000815 [Microgenomates bacterium OLB23]